MKKLFKSYLFKFKSKGRFFQMSSLIIGGYIMKNRIYNNEVYSQEQNQVNMGEQFQINDMNGHQLFKILSNQVIYSNTLIFINKVDDLVVQRLRNRYPNLKFYIYTTCQNDLSYIQNNFANLEDYSIVAVNQEGDLRLFVLNNECDYFFIDSFYNPPKVVDQFEENHDFIQNITDLSNQDIVIFTYIPEKHYYQNREKQFPLKNLELLESQFRQLRYKFKSNNAYFYIIRDDKLMKKFNISQGDIGEIYVMKKQSNLNNNDTNFMIAQKDYILNKLSNDSNSEIQQIELKFQEILDLLHQQSLNYVNLINTEAEMYNFERVIKELKIKKLLIFYDNDDDEMEKKLKKFSRLKKDPLFQKEKIEIVQTNNPNLLTKQFRIIPDKYSDTIRLISLNDYREDEKMKYFDKNEFILDKQDQERFRFDQKLTKKNLLQFVVQPQIQYYESSAMTQVQNSNLLIGSTFYKDVLASKQNHMVIFYKPGCAACKSLLPNYEYFLEEIIQIQQYIKEDDNNSKQYQKQILNKYKIRNPNNFKDIKISRYNIFNECPEFPSPSTAPLIIYFQKDTNSNKIQPIIIDLVGQKVDISDKERVTKLLIKNIDQPYVQK